VPTGWTIARTAGTNSICLAAPEVITAGVSQKLVLTITPPATTDGTTMHTFRLSQTSTTPFLFSSMGLAEGDWVEFGCTIELSAWGAWVSINTYNELGNATAFHWQGNTGIGNADTTTQVLPNVAIAGFAWTRFRLQPGFVPPLDRFRINSRPIEIQFRSDKGAAPGVIKLGPQIYRKIADPTAAWSLP
jgi:hypothetical protein